MNDFFEQLQLMLLRYRIGRYFSARGEFVRRTRNEFLSAVRARAPQGAGQPVSSLPRLALQAAMVVFLSLFLVDGTAFVYADQKNVSSDSPLYGLKRFAERVRLALAPSPAAKATLHTAFAQRRLREIETAQNRKTPKWKLETLDRAFHTEVKLAVTAGTTTNTENMHEVCESLIKLIDSRKHTNASTPWKWKTLRARCSGVVPLETLDD